MSKRADNLVVPAFRGELEKVARSAKRVRGTHPMMTGFFPLCPGVGRGALWAEFAAALEMARGGGGREGKSVPRQRGSFSCCRWSGLKFSQSS